MDKEELASVGDKGSACLKHFSLFSLLTDATDTNDM